MRIWLAYDWHLHAVHAFPREALPIGGDVYIGGDHVDFAHCLRRDLGLAVREARLVGKAYRNRVVRGNHELNFVDWPEAIKVHNTAIIHGHQIWWTQAKCAAWASKYRGGIMIPQLAITAGTYDACRYLIPLPNALTPEQSAIAEKLAAQMGCNRIITGHLHPRAPFELRTPNGIVVTCCPRGLTEIEV